jgi:hypothetical protein
MSDCQSKTNVIVKKLCMNTVHKFNTCCVEYLHIFGGKIISFIFAESRNYRPAKAQTRLLPSVESLYHTTEILGV